MLRAIKGTKNQQDTASVSVTSASSENATGDGGEMATPRSYRAVMRNAQESMRARRAIEGLKIERARSAGPVCSFLTQLTCSWGLAGGLGTPLLRAVTGTLHVVRPPLALARARHQRPAGRIAAAPGV